jgi:UDP-GlcNAc:undecaprenyl-phosphate/decaprenyl-phosphate GlcNAc-1-phosphate transferase
MVFSNTPILILALLVLQVALTLLTRNIFIAHGLVDHPGGRKKHFDGIPFNGGVVIFSGLTTLLVLTHQSHWLLSVYLASLFVFVISFMDDVVGLPSYVRLLFQLLAVSFLVIFLQGFNPLSWLHLIPDRHFYIELAGVIFLILCGCGTINAFNMSDGIDGLCAGLAVLASLSLAFVFYSLDSLMWLNTCLALVCMLSVFLYFNLSSRWKVFLGDGGSATLGFFIFAVILIMILKLHVLTISAAIWFVGCPLMGMGRVVLLRLLAKRSPFKADRLHVHYVLLDNNLAKHWVLAIILTCQAFFCCVGILCYLLSVSSAVSLSIFASTFAMVFVVMQAGNRDRLISCLCRHAASPPIFQVEVDSS